MTEHKSDVRSGKVFDAHSDNPNYFGADTLEWDEYHQVRPEYPAALYDILFEYHKLKSGTDKATWQRAADFGSGPGTILPSVLSRFQRVDGSDLNARQVELGERALSSAYGKDRVRMHVGAAGSSTWLEDGSIDLFTSAEAVQWFDTAAWVAEAAQKLKSGGTLSFWYYSPNLTIISHSEAAPLCNKLFSILFESVWSSDGFPRAPVEAHAHKLRNIAIDDKHFHAEERHFWDLPHEVEGIHGLGENPPSSYELVKDTQSGVSLDARVVNHSDESKTCFLQRGPWTTNDLLQYIESLGMPMEVLFKHPDFTSTMEALHRSVGGKNGTFFVGWWLALVMATRR